MNEPNLNQNYIPNYQNFINPNQNFIPNQINYINPQGYPQVINTNPNYVPSQIIIINQNPNQIQQAPPKRIDPILIWYDLSLISWFLMLCSGWNLYLRFYFEQKPLVYYPMPIESPLSLGMTLVICTIGFFVYFRKTTLTKNDEIYRGMLSEISKYHSIAFFLVTAMFLILTGGSNVTSHAFGLGIGACAYGSLMFIYIFSSFPAEWYEILVLKKGTISGLIAIMSYALFYCFASFRDELKYAKGTGIAFSILTGVGNLLFAALYRDVFVAMVNMIHFIELSKTIFILPTKQTAEGVIDIFIVLGSIATLGYLFLKERKYLFVEN